MEFLVTTLVSNTVIAIAIALVAVIVGRTRRSPQFTHVLWLLVLVKLVTPPLIDVALPTFNRNSVLIEPTPTERAQTIDTVDAERFEPAVESGFERDVPVWNSVEPPTVSSIVPSESVQIADETAADGPVVAANVVTTLQDVFVVLLALWGAGSLLFIALLVRRYVAFRRLMQSGQAAPDEVLERLQALAEQLELRNPPGLLIVDAHVPPLVWSVLSRPTIVLPAGLMSTLDQQQSDAVLLHELAHVRRGDHRLRWFDTLVLVALWWHPLAWWARSSLRRAEEECCDAWVVWALPNAAREYGRALLETVEFLTESVRVPMVSGTTLGGSELKRRVEMIVDARAGRRLSRVSLVVVLAIAAVALPVRGQRGSQSTDDSDTKAEAAQADQSAENTVDDTDAAGSEQLTEPADEFANADWNAAGERMVQTRQQALLARLETLEEMVRQLVEANRSTADSVTRLSNVAVAESAFNAEPQVSYPFATNTRTVAVSAAGKYVATLVSIGQSSRVEIFDAKSGKLLSSTQLKSGANRLAFAEKDKQLVVTGRSTITTLSAPAGRQLKVARIRPPARQPGDPVTGQPDPRRIYVEKTTLTVQFESLLNAYNIQARLLTQDREFQNEMKLHTMGLELEEAKVAVAEKALERAKRMQQRGYVSEDEVQKAEVDLKSARLSLEKVKQKTEAKRSNRNQRKQQFEAAEAALVDLIKKHPDHPVARDFIREHMSDR